MLALASPKKSPRGIARAHVGVIGHACVCAGVHIHTPQTLDKRHKKSFMQNKQAKYRTNKQNTEYKRKTEQTSKIQNTSERQNKQAKYRIQAKDTCMHMYAYKRDVYTRKMRNNA